MVMSQSKGTRNNKLTRYFFIERSARICLMTKNMSLFSVRKSRKDLLPKSQPRLDGIENPLDLDWSTSFGRREKPKRAHISLTPIELE